MVKCKNCKNNHLLFAEDINGENVPFHFCNKVNDSLDVNEKRSCEHYERATNFDVLRSIKPNELAHFLESGGFECHLCSEHERLSDQPIKSVDTCDQKCYAHCLEWLDKPVEE